MGAGGVEKIAQSSPWQEISFHFLFLFFYRFFIYLATLGLHCFSRAFSSCGEGALFSSFGAWPLSVVTSLTVEHRL